jgi:hypothetical protein
VQRHQLLAGLQQRLRPRTYFEIGVRKGKSLELSRTPTVGVDPFFEVNREIRCDVHLVRTTSDEFFARRHPFAHLPEPVLDLAFIDGMHLAEFALRDFMNTERFCHPASVIVIDDVLPRNVVEASRGRVGPTEHGAWAGDVYKVLEVLRRLRPDLLVLEVDTKPTGTVVVLRPDPTNDVLHAAYDDLVPQLVSPEPQDVPAWVLGRTTAIDPKVLLRSSVWSELRRIRERPGPHARAAVETACAEAGLRQERTTS